MINSFTVHWSKSDERNDRPWGHPLIMSTIFRKCFTPLPLCQQMSIFSDPLIKLCQKVFTSLNKVTLFYMASFFVKTMEIKRSTNKYEDAILGLPWQELNWFRINLVGWWRASVFRSNAPTIQFSYFLFIKFVVKNNIVDVNLSWTSLSPCQQLSNIFKPHILPYSVDIINGDP